MNILRTNTNLRTAIYVTISTAIVFVFLFSYIGIKTRNYAYEDSKKLAKEISRKEAMATEMYISSALMVARSLVQKSQIIREGGLSRDYFVKNIKASLTRNPEILAIWTMWEPNCFDNNDAHYIGDTLYDKNGTMSVTFFNYNGKMLFERNSPNDHNEDYYTIPKKSRSELLIDPFYYKYHGHPYIFFETSIVIPIIENSKFLGVVGVDLNLENLSNDINKIKLYKSGYLSVISNNGLIISHPEKPFIEKNIFSIVKEKDSITLKTIKNGKELSIETKSEFTGSDVFRFFYPIKIGKGDTPWSMMVEIPISEATIRSKQLQIIAYFTLFIGLSLLIYLIINILDRKRYEKSLIEAREKAEESDSLKTAFLNNISHEIRTPLNGIVGFSELLTNSEHSKETNQTFNDIIRNSCNQLLSVINNVLELSKIQTGEVSIYITNISLDKSIDIIVKTFEAFATDKGIKIVKKLPQNAKLVRMRTDEGKLHQILSNLLDNAIKYSNGGTIEIGFEIMPSHFKFFVKDQGVGINSEMAKSLYDLFSKGENIPNNTFGGIGIGLAITKSFVELMGGKIWFESEVNKGSTFFFVLPNNKSFIQNEFADTNTKLKELNDFKILITEDEKSNYTLIRELFKNTKAELVWAKNGDEAITYCQTDESINLVLMDIKLPGMNGYEVTKLIKSIRSDLPVIAVSAFLQSKDSEQQIVFDSIISKPFKADEFISTIMKYA